MKERYLVVVKGMAGHEKRNTLLVNCQVMLHSEPSQTHNKRLICCS